MQSIYIPATFILGKHCFPAVFFAFKRGKKLGIGTWCIEELPSIPIWKLGQSGTDPGGGRLGAQPLQTYYFSNFFYNSIDLDITRYYFIPIAVRYCIGMIILY